MNTLLVYPQFPDTYWSFKHALSFIGKRAAQPPLGLMTIAALLPSAWSKLLVDLNVERLRGRLRHPGHRWCGLWRCTTLFRESWQSPP